MSNVDYAIGRELIMLSHTIEHIEYMENYYDSIVARDGSLNRMEDHEDHSERYMTVQHLANFEQLKAEDLENHYMGFEIRIVKRDKVLQILDDKQEFLKTIKQIAKDRIFQYLNKHQVEFSGKAIHYFLGSKMYAVFEVDIPENTRDLNVTDAYVGYSQDQREEYPSLRYAHMIGLQL